MTQNSLQEQLKERSLERLKENLIKLSDAIEQIKRDCNEAEKLFTAIAYQVDNLKN